MKSDKRWLERQNRDPYVKQARNSSYRSRAVYKLQEIDQRDRLFRPGQLVVDLGSAPGSWSQYAAEKVSPAGKVIALDILAMPPINGVEFIQGDFTEQSVFDQCLACLNGKKADLVISDMAPNLTGIRDTDQARSMYLAELALDFAAAVLDPRGNLLIKVFEGAGMEQFKRALNEQFQRVSVRKPDASRSGSREFYILARRN
jgi:23S rRNA (uridine2552-2'-O)-methyltransferase